MINRAQSGRRWCNSGQRSINGRLRERDETPEIHLFGAAGSMASCVLTGFFYRGNFEEMHVFGCGAAERIIPLSRYAELNQRLSEVQPGTHFFFAPSDGLGDFPAGIILTPGNKGKAEMSPAAKAVPETWKEENRERFPLRYELPY